MRPASLGCRPPLGRTDSRFLSGAPVFASLRYAWLANTYRKTILVRRSVNGGGFLSGTHLLEEGCSMRYRCASKNMGLFQQITAGKNWSARP